MTRNLTTEEIKNVFIASRLELLGVIPANEEIPDRYVQLAAYCSRAGIDAFCEANGIELPPDYPEASDHGEQTH